MWCCSKVPDPCACSAGLATVVLTPMKEVTGQMQVPNVAHAVPSGLSMVSQRILSFSYKFYRCIRSIRSSVGSSHSNL